MTTKYAKYPHWEGLKKDKDDPRTIEEAMASLDEGGKVPTTQLGGSGADATKFLRGDQSWQVPAAGGPPAEGRAVLATTPFFSIPGVEPVSVGNTSTDPLAANTLYHEPIYVATQITIDQILIEVSSGNAGSARLGIYSADTDWQPVALILDAGTVDMTTTGVKAIDISQVLSPGRYLLVLVAEVTPVLRFIRGGNRYTGMRTIIGTSPFPYRIYRSFAYASLPEPPSDWDTVVYSGLPFQHHIFVRVSTP